MDDLISKQAAIDEIEYELEMINSALDSITLDFNARERLRQRRGEAREILNSIQQLPSVKPEQKKGKWKKRVAVHNINGESRNAIVCSICGSGYFRYDTSENTESVMPNYCPNCGADMRGEKQDD